MRYMIYMIDIRDMLYDGFVIYFRIKYVFYLSSFSEFWNWN